MAVSAAQIAEAILLGVGVVVCWLCAGGVLVMPTVYDKLHYLSPASLVGGAAVLVAMFVHSGLSTETGKVCLIILLLWVSNPLLTYATARAALARESRRTHAEPEKPS
jgi:multicomponent Na+:H+ antiporter subunit G